MQDQSQVNERNKRSELESEKCRLENSLQSIAQAVINDIDKLEEVDVDIDTSQGMGHYDDGQGQSQIPVTPLRYNQSDLTSSTPILSGRALRYG